MNYQKIAKEVVLDYANKHIDKTDNVQITLDDVYVVWFCKTLQNWKALLSTTLPDGMYYMERRPERCSPHTRWQN